MALLVPYFVDPRSETSFQYPLFVTPRLDQEYPCVPSVRGSSKHPEVIRGNKNEVVITLDMGVGPGVLQRVRDHLL